MLYRSRWRRAQVAVAERQPREQARADQAQREARRTGGFVRRRARLGTASLSVGGNASISLADTTPPLVIAKRTTGVCDVGERGVCDEAYTLPDGKGDRQPDWSFIFESGRHDGFSPDEVELILEITGELCPSSRLRFPRVAPDQRLPTGPLRPGVPARTAGDGL